MTVRYVLQALLRRPAETLAAALAVALTVAFLASLGSFTAQTGSRLTLRAADRVPVDWQVQVTAGSDPAAVRDALNGVPGVVGVRAVDYAKVDGLSSVSATGGTRTTGAAYVVSLPADYASFAPGELRTLVGSTAGVVLQQQTASNLSAAPGTTVTVLGTGKTVTVAGVVDLPNADSFFQVVGAPAGSGASAPPDNVLLVSPSAFPSLVTGATVIHQFHVRLDHAALPSDPATAADEVTRRANHYVAAVAGGALIGDDLGVSLSAAREDALYARLLVLLLGVPGLLLSGVVTALVISLRNDRQRRDLALLRLRGATPRRAATLLGVTALIDGLLGAVLGAGGALLATALALGPGAHLSLLWLGVGVLVGVLLAVGIELAPVARLLRGESPTVQDGATQLPSTRTPLALRLGLDVVLLAGSAVVFWLTARGGYQVVVVPEGVPVASVNYAALLAPVLAWPGMALLTWRITAAVLSPPVRPAATDPAGRMPDLRRAVVRRRRRLVARGVTGLTIAIAVTASAAVFTNTYDQQARLDTALTVGSDVAVTVAADSPSSLDPAIAAVPGVTAVEQVSHRLAYVGPDLQDVYGIDAATVGRAAPLQDAFTPGSSIRSVLKRLAGTPDGALLSQETLHDYQLHIGDLVQLRLKTAQGGYHTVRFHVVGVITEFATAPRDSFVIANRQYLTTATGLSAVQTLLIRTDHPKQVAATVHAPAAALINDITAPRVAVPSASGLAAGSLSGLARLTLAFGLLLAAASAGLVLIVGAVQRRRSMVALAVLGADARQRAGFLWTEARTLTVAGMVGGLTTGALIAAELIKVLNGIFDPPPQHPAVPWTFVGTVLLVVLAAAALATAGSARWTARVDASRLRDL
ncbi:MAG: putative transport system permease protein [Actinoplanes sp.]|jgi:putative ABC transport system permease protein|nr:putative transport system permease protein [Actinoplanes sp.]